MLKVILASLILTTSVLAQVHPVQELIDAARTDSPKLKELLDAKDEYGKRLVELAGRDGVAVWGQEFVFAVESAAPASVIIDKEAPVPMKRVAGTNYWYLWKMLRLGTTHRNQYVTTEGGRNIGAPYEVPAYNPDSYPLPGVPRGKLSERKTLTSTIYPGMTANYWVYANPGIDTTRGAPLMVWQDGETIVGNQDLVRLRLQIVSDNLVSKKLIPPMVHVLIQPGTVDGRALRSVQYDTVSNLYGRYVLEEILPDVEKTYKIRPDAYSRAVAGASSGAICAFNVAWYHPEKFSRVLSHIGSFTALQWRPQENLDGGYIVPVKVRREAQKNLRVWLSDGSEDQEHASGSWPLNNIQLANSLKMRNYDFHFRFGTSLHAIAQGAMDLPESLTWLWRDYDPAKTEQKYEMEAAEKAKPLYRVGITNREAH